MFIDSRIVLVSMKSSEVSQNLPIMQAHRPMVVLFLADFVVQTQIGH